MIDLYGALVRRVLYPTWEKRIKKRPVLDLLADLRKRERAPLEKLQRQQTQALGRLLHHAQVHCPHYREGFSNWDFSAGEPVPLEVLAQLPMLPRQAARESVKTRIAVPGPAIAVSKTTGGTTGEPLVIQYDLGSEHWRQAIRLRGFGWAGYEVGAKSVHYWGAPSKPNMTWQARAKIALDRGIKREHYIDCTPRGDDAKAEAVKILQRVRPRFLFCYAQAAADLARYVIRTNSRSWPDITVIGGAEKIYPDDREIMEQAFGPVFETYGCREVMLIGTECAAHSGLHLSMENVIVELVDDAGKPVAPGQVGHVVLTDLHNYGSPLIRYVNGDMAIAESTQCPCGRAHPRLASIEGRKTETVIDNHGNPVGGMVFNLLFSPLADEVQQFQAVQHADKSITLKLVTPTEISPRVRDHIATQTAKYLHGLPLKIERVDAIPLSKSGKRRIVVVE